MNLHPSPSPNPRARYCAVAVELAHRPPDNGLPEAPFLAASVTLTDVAAALGVTRSALYKVWSSQYDFWVDLARYLAYDLDFSQDDQEMPWQAARRVAPDLAHLTRQEVDDAFRVRGEVAQDLVLADTRVLIRAASLGYGDIADVGQIRRAVEARRLHHLAADIALTLALLGRTPTTPSCEHDVAAIIWCISDELSVLAHHLPDLVAERIPLDLGDGAAPWTYLAVAARAIYLGFSTTGPGDPTPAPPPPLPDIPAVAEVWSERQLKVLGVAVDLFVAAIGSPRPEQSVAPEGPSALGHVTIAEVARAAGVSRRTVYNLWPTRRAMTADMLEHLLAEQMEAIDSAVEQCASSAPGGVGLAALTDEIIGPADAAPRVQPWLGFLIEPGDETVRALLPAMHQACLTRATDYIEFQMATQGRQPLPGLQARHLALLWLCLLRGGLRLQRTSPGVTWAYGAAAEALLDQLTFPV